MLVSFLIPVYNASNHLRATLDSVFAQTYTDFECIVVNDGSTDESADILAGYKDSRLKIINLDKNVGVSEALNKGVVEAKGKYIARLDADDIALPHRLAVQVNYIIVHPEVVLLGSSVNIIDNQGVIKGAMLYNFPPETIASHLLFHNTFATCSVLCKTEVLKEFPFETAFAPAEDYLTWVRIAQKYPVALLPEVLAQYRVHNTNASIVRFGHLQNLVWLIYAEQLRRLGIEATQEDLILHDKIGNWAFERGPDFLEKSSNWLYLLYQKNNTFNVYNRIYFNHYIVKLWLALCYFQQEKSQVSMLATSSPLWKQISWVQRLKLRLRWFWLNKIHNTQQ